MVMVEEGRIPPKRIQFQEIVEKGKEDRISALPDSLLLEILSRLPATKDAIRTGTLSKRWEHVWTLVPTVIFNDYSDNPMWPDIVDKTLTQCRQLKLKRFEVYISHYDVRFESQVNNMIHYAVSRNVEELNLRLFPRSEDEFRLDQYFFISSYFTDLILEGCILNPTGAVSWRNLRSLCMFDGKLDEDLIENILSGSPVLETLVLDRCYGYRRLDITSKNVKKLVFYGYNDPEDKYDDLADIIEINAPNILSLTIQGHLLLLKILLMNVSSLVKANLDYNKMGHWETSRKDEEDEMLKGFILNLRHVKELKIGWFCAKVLFRLEAKGFVFPSNVKFPDGFYKKLEQGDWSDGDSFTSEDCDSFEIEDF